MRLIITLGLMLLLFQVNGQQNKYTLHFKAGEFVPEKNLKAVIKDPSAMRASAVNGKIYLVLQFNELPDERVKAELSASGIKLIDYIPDLAYTASLPAELDFSKLNPQIIRSVFILENKYKIDEKFITGDVPSWAVKEPGFIDVNTIIADNNDTSGIAGMLKSFDARVLSYDAQFRTLRLRAPLSQIQNIASLSIIQWIEPVTPPPVKENLPGKTLHRSNVLNDGTRNLTGSGIKIGEWDEGQIGPHLDFTGRLTLVQTTQPSSEHSTHVCGTMAGAGLLDPFARGMAPSAQIYCYDYNGTISTEVSSAISTYGIVMTQNSYGYGDDYVNCVVKDTYNSESYGQDVNVVNNPFLMHVHSAGNSQHVCSGGWGTTTGKAAKNILVVANVTTDDVISSSSSFGPVQDGRIKPEISALGTDVYSTTSNNTYTGGYTGTSMATPGVSGTVAQLYERYRQLNANANPPASLLKALACNTAKDLGNAGPDYKYGFGRIDGLVAVRAMEANRYAVTTVANGVTNYLTVNIPAGTVKMKAMLCWTDPAGAINANPALVNSLRLSVKDPAAATFLPWILDPANPANVAVRGVDTKNNIQQVTFDNPVAGVCSLIVSGAVVTTASQQYSLTWEFETAGVEVTYPNGNEIVTPGSTQVITWNNPGVTSVQTIEYSTNNGAAWTTISSAVPASSARLSWTVPAVITKQALVRVTAGALSDVSDLPFTILGTPTGLTATPACGGNINLSWSAVANATHYDVLNLDTVTGVWNVLAGNVAATSYAATGLVNQRRYWFSVRALNNTSVITGQRAIAVKATPVTATVAPVQPGAISGSTTVCAYAASVTYSIAAMTTAASYTWTAPSGATILTGQGTTIITVKFGLTGGNISVVAVNPCGTSPSKSLAITITSVEPGTISGITNPCFFQQGVVYSIAAVSGASSYTWSGPAGSTLTAGQGTISATFTLGNTNGNISVYATGSGCTSSVRTLALVMKASPSTPIITSTGSAVICAGSSVQLNAAQSENCAAAPVCSGTVITSAIGTGSSSNTNIAYPAVYGNYYESNREQYLIKASELTAAGLVKGLINSISFDVASANGTGVQKEFTIKLACTSAASLSTFIAGGVTVYGPVNYTPVAGVNLHAFTYAYFWDGTSNLLVEVCHNNDTGPSVVDYTVNASTKFTTTAFNSVVHTEDDNLGSLCGTASTVSVSAIRPNMILKGGCPGETMTYTWTPASSVTPSTGTPVTATPAATTSYTVVAQSSNGCTASSAPFAVTVNNCTVTLNLQAFIEGFYAGSQMMQPVIYQLGLTANSSATDSVTILLYLSTNVVTPAYSGKALLDKTGLATFTFTMNQGSYYIAVTHRNSLKVWSAAPVAFSGSTAAYTFKDVITSAYGSNLKNLGDGKFAIPAGDTDQDGDIDVTDITNVENAAKAFLYGYLVTDLTGDGVTESSDYTLIENNAGKTVSHP